MSDGNTKPLGRMLVAECPVCRRLFLGTSAAAALVHVCIDETRRFLEIRLVEVHDLGHRPESKAP